MSPSPDIPALPDRDKLAILVVDDEPTLRLGFAYALSSKVTTVETASNGRQALQRIAEQPFDVMILDLRMPELDGMAVLEALRAQGNRMPVILCSAALNPRDSLRAIRHRVVDFLLKPVRPVDLRQVVDFVVRPETDSFSQAMVALRNGRFDQAASLLDGEGDGRPRTRCWAKLVEAMRTGQDDSDLEPMVRTILPVIAFNSTILS